MKERLHLKLAPAVKEALTVLAVEDGLSLSAFVERMVRNAASRRGFGTRNRVGRTLNDAISAEAARLYGAVAGLLPRGPVGSSVPAGAGDPLNACADALRELEEKTRR